MKKYPSMIDRLLANSMLRDDDDCWTWIGARKVNRSGMFYGKLNVRMKRGPRKGKVVTLQAHRVSYAAFFGVRITPKTVVRHTCDNSLCINPGHLIKGSLSDNARDCVKRGRHRNQYSEPPCA